MDNILLGSKPLFSFPSKTWTYFNFLQSDFIIYSPTLFMPPTPSLYNFKTLLWSILLSSCSWLWSVIMWVTHLTLAFQVSSSQSGSTYHSSFPFRGHRSAHLAQQLHHLQNLDFKHANNWPPLSILPVHALQQFISLILPSHPLIFPLSHHPSCSSYPHFSSCSA